MLGINERHVCVCKGEQQRVSGWSLTPILTHQYVTVAHFNALQRSPALHCVYKVLYCMPCIAKGWDLRQAQLMSGQRVSLCQRKAELFHLENGCSSNVTQILRWVEKEQDQGHLWMWMEATCILWTRKSIILMPSDISKWSFDPAIPICFFAITWAGQFSNANFWGR